MTKMSARRRLVALRALREILGGGGASGASRDAAGVAGTAADRDWEDVVAVADELIVMPALARALASDPAIPAELREQLREWQRGNALRNARLRDQLRGVVVALNDAGIVPLLFKGSLHLMDGTLRGTGGRYMSDLDLLVPSDRFGATQAALERLGYVPSRSRPFEHPHELTFSRRGAIAPIDLHDALLGPDRLAEALSTPAIWQDGSEIELGGCRVRALAPTDQVLHNVLHAAIQDFNHAVGGLPLRQLLALEDILLAHGRAIDWPAVQARMHRLGQARTLRDHLWLASRYTRAPIPAGLLDSSARAFERRVVLGFALGWPPHAQRNLHQAFGRAYLESRYGSAAGRLGLLRARLRHAVTLARTQPRRIRRQTVMRRN